MMKAIVEFLESMIAGLYELAPVYIVAENNEYEN